MASGMKDDSGVRFSAIRPCAFERKKRSQSGECLSDLSSAFQHRHC